MMGKQIGSGGFPAIEDDTPSMEEQFGEPVRFQCKRCEDWERMGLSRYCPSCDAEYLDELELIRARGHSHE